jgi:hypothetical protein
MAKEAAEIEAILARLREEVGRKDGESGTRPLPSRGARAALEHLWSVTAEPHLACGRGPLGWVKHVVKVVLYRAMRWYVEPFAGMQREYNLAALKLADELAGRVTELEERLAQVEKRPPGP